MGSVTDDPIYRIMIARNGISVVANAGAKLSFNINNQWINVMQALGLGTEGTDSMLSKAINGFQIFSGNNFLPKIATSHVWRGSNGLEIQLQLRFDAWDDARKDVLKPVQDLIRIFMPNRSGKSEGALDSLASIKSLIGNQFLKPPGPTPYETLSGNWKSKAVTLIVGKVWKLDDLIPTTFALEFEDRYTKEGDPICAKVTVGFMSFMTPDQDDVVGYFQAGAV